MDPKIETPIMTNDVVPESPGDIDGVEVAATPGKGMELRTSDGDSVHSANSRTHLEVHQSVISNMYSPTNDKEIPASIESESTQIRTKDIVRIFTSDHDNMYLEVTPEELERVKCMHEKLLEGTTFSFNYNCLLFVASILAGLGLISNSATTIIASMLVSPIMGPVIGLAYGSTIRDWKLVNKSLQVELISILFCILIGMLLGCVAGPTDISHTWPTQEMLNRGTKENFLVALPVAFFSGLGVAVSVLDDQTASLVGVAISASLLPPAVNAGILWVAYFFAEVNVVNGVCDRYNDTNGDQFNDTNRVLYYNETNSDLYYNGTNCDLYYNETNSDLYYNGTNCGLYNDTNSDLYYNDTNSDLYNNETNSSIATGSAIFSDTLSSSATSIDCEGLLDKFGVQNYTIETYYRTGLISLMVTISNIALIWISSMLMFRMKEVLPIKKNLFWSDLSIARKVYQKRALIRVDNVFASDVGLANGSKPVSVFRSDNAISPV